jgi:hypothetical protein
LEHQFQNGVNPRSKPATPDFASVNRIRGAIIRPAGATSLNLNLMETIESEPHLFVV